MFTRKVKLYGGILGFTLLLVTFFGIAPVFCEDWGKEKKVVEKYFPQKIIVTSASIDSLLNGPLTINDCVAVALKNNLQLQIDRLEYNRVYHAKKGTAQAYLPTVGLFAEGSQTFIRDTLDTTSEEFLDEGVGVELSERMPLGGSLRFTSGANRFTNESTRLSDEPTIAWTISFIQPILKGFGYSIAYSDVKLADLDFLIERTRLQDAILATILSIKSAYYEVLGRKRLISATEAAIERDKKLIEISEAKVEAKLATRRDILSAEIILQQDYADLVTAQTDYQEALDILKNRLGIEIARDISLAIEELEFVPVLIEEENWIEIALINNTAIKFQEALLEKGKFQIKLTGNSRLPDLALEGSYTRIDDDDVLRDERSYNLTGRITFSYPLFNLNAGAEHQRAILAQRQLERNLNDTQRNVIQFIRSVARNLQKSGERIKILLRNIDSAKEKVEFATAMFNLGKASNLDITDAQKDLLEAEVNYAEELADYYIQQARLEQLLGGHSIINPNE